MATIRTYGVKGQLINIYTEFNTDTSDVSIGVSLNEQNVFTLNNKNSFTFDDIDEDALKDQLNSIIECFNRELICFIQDIVSTDNYITNDRVNITEDGLTIG